MHIKVASAARRLTQVAMMLVLLLPRAALADARADKEACVAAHEQGQELRLRSKWLEARTRFAACAQSSCPAPVMNDCLRWSEELNASMPSIVVVARAPDGSDTVTAALSIDGTKVASTLSAAPIELDPGEHVLRLVHAPWPDAERRVVVRAEERGKRVDIAFQTKPSGAEVAPAPAPAPAPIERRRPIFMYAMTGVAIGGAIAGTTFGVLGRVAEDDLAASPCGQTRTCSDEAVDPVRTKYAIAGVSVGVAVVAATLALYSYLSSR